MGAVAVVALVWDLSLGWVGAVSGVVGGGAEGAPGGRLAVPRQVAEGLAVEASGGFWSVVSGLVRS